ncbi:AAA family ATPase [Polyangium mundeleinium]|uniref:AAA family ATPase n=1 Tax=Polyangium mundeleinium TaxID=2995306 RepID=A0ABT5ESQ5_9BACT|nr:AAA family ATPase [Polyangium mundeleinium]MDC0744853.1 AAA family ATPase [Polyangium mundeleinium]
MTEHDALLRVFLSGAKKDLFHSVEHRSQIWREDPFDVESVHADARAQFQRLLAHATTPPGLDSGRILMLLGESGSGKTHLLRAFRNHVHVHGLGFVGYMQMSTSITSYPRYLMSNLIDSLDQAYYESAGTGSGLLRLSNAIASRCGDPDAIRALNEKASLSAGDIIDLVERAADRLIAHPRYADLDLDLVRALLFLQRHEPALKKRVVKYLRCEALVEGDRRFLGSISPKAGDDDAQRLVEELGRLIAAFDNRSLILCVDQFEDTWHSGDAAPEFRRVTSSLCGVADQVPSSIIVIACLEDYYAMLRSRLSLSTLDRLEHDPAPVRLVAERSADEIENIIAQRLGYLYETAGVKPAHGVVDPLYPFPRDFVLGRDGMRFRDVLNACQRFREACIEAGRIVDPKGFFLTQPTPSISTDALDAKAVKEKIERDWNDFLAQYGEDQTESEVEIVKLFGWAVENCAEGLNGGYRFDVTVKGESLNIRLMVPCGNGDHGLGEEIFVALCNRAPQGSGLHRQVQAARKEAKQRVLAILRSTEFPTSRKTVIWKAIDDITKNGGRKAVLEQSHQRMLAAFRKFRSEQGQRPHFQEWLREGKHLSKILPISHILDLENLERFEKARGSRPASRA